VAQTPGFHNPVEYNGVKMVHSQAVRLGVLSNKGKVLIARRFLAAESS
jgi:hypothetical protein